MSIDKLLIHSNDPRVKSGYGTQCQLLLRILETLGWAPDKVAVSAFHGIQGFVDEWQGHKIFPGGQDPYGGDIVGMHARHFGADLVITLMDQWALAHETLAGLNWAAWMPVDGFRLSVYDHQRLAASKAIPVAISKFGQAQLTEAGFDALYVPHAIDTDVYKPVDNRDEVRAELNITGLFAVILCSANRDKSRKAFPAQMEAFRVFHAKHPDSVLMIHADESHRLGLNLRSLAERIDMTPNSYRFSHQYLLASGQLEDWRMAGTYAACDLGTQAAMGEGFGLPCAEEMSCGTPVVVTDASAMTEVCGPGGWKVRGEKAWATGHESWWRMPYQAELARVYEKAYERGAAYNAKKAKARQHIIDNYSIPVVTEIWRDTLAQIEKRMR